MSGSIKLIIGSMFSGKSTEVIRLIKRFKVLNLNILAINHSLDDRYDKDKIVTHNQEKLDCLSLDKLMNLIGTKRYNDSQIIVIEEGQFFDDLFEFATVSADKYNKKMIIAGLDGDYNRKPFGDILRLIPHCESVNKLHALCSICNDGTKASFTKRIVSEESNILVGSNDSYIAVCRKHYLI